MCIRDSVKAMLEAGKQVATSNKNLVAAKGAELIKVAVSYTHLTCECGQKNTGKFCSNCGKPRA